MHTLRSIARTFRTLERGPKMISYHPLTLQNRHTSPLILIMGHPLLTCTLRMTHQPGTSTRAGIDLHLGQKPKLGGGIPTSHSFIYHILSVLCTSTFPFLSFRLLFLFCYCFPKYKKTKNISVVSLCLFLQFLLLVCFTFQFQFIIQKPKKIWLCLLVSFWSCLKFKNPKIFVVLLRFCKVCCRVQQSSVTPLELGYHFTSFKPHK